MSDPDPLVGVIMGSKSDWDTMSQTDAILTEFGVPHECQVMSAHRTPMLTAEYAATAANRDGAQVSEVPPAGGAVPARPDVEGLANPQNDRAGEGVPDIHAIGNGSQGH